jgi:hypothetical protein
MVAISIASASITKSEAETIRHIPSAEKSISA